MSRVPRAVPPLLVRLSTGPLPAAQGPRWPGCPPQSPALPASPRKPVPSVSQLPGRRRPHCHLGLPAHPARRASGPCAHHWHHRVPFRPGEHHLQVPVAWWPCAGGPCAGAAVRGVCAPGLPWVPCATVVAVCTCGGDHDRFAGSRSLLSGSFRTRTRDRLMNVARFCSEPCPGSGKGRGCSGQSQPGGEGLLGGLCDGPVAGAGRRCVSVGQGSGLGPELRVSQVVEGPGDLCGAR